MTGMTAAFFTCAAFYAVGAWQGWFFTDRGGSDTVGTLLGVPAGLYAAAYPLLLLAEALGLSGR